MSAINACAAPRADALWYHAPNICEHVQLDRATPGQMLVVASMEPAAYYPCLDNPAFMGLFDLEMSYRMQARRALPDAARIMHIHRRTTCALLCARACGIHAQHDATVMLPRASSVYVGGQADAFLSAPFLSYFLSCCCSSGLAGSNGLPDSSCSPATVLPDPHRSSASRPCAASTARTSVTRGVAGPGAVPDPGALPARGPGRRLGGPAGAVRRARQRGRLRAEQLQRAQRAQPDRLQPPGLCRPGGQLVRQVRGPVAWPEASATAAS